MLSEEAAGHAPLGDTPRVRAGMLAQHNAMAAAAAPLAELSASISSLASGTAALASAGVAGREALLTAEDSAGVGEVYAQLAEFGEALQAQLSAVVLAPLTELQQTCLAAVRRSKAFDEESEALEAAHRAYLSHSREASLETRAVAAQELDDRLATASLSLLDTREALREACGGLRAAPQRAVGELLVAQLSYHQSCARLLADRIELAKALLSSADQTSQCLAAESAAASALRGAMPRPMSRDTATAPLVEGWLQKGSFNLSTPGERSSLHRLRPWSRRYFVLDPSGKLYFYKEREAADGGRASMQVPLDLRLVSAVTAVNGPLEFELCLGSRTLRLKAFDLADRLKWTEALSSYLASHGEEREAAQRAYRHRLLARGTGVRDFGGGEGDAGESSNGTSLCGYLFRQDSDLRGRWRRWWCEASDEHDFAAAAARPSLGHAPQQRGVLLPQQGSGAPVLSIDDAAAPLPFREAARTVFPLATVTVREARSQPLPFCFEVISPAGSALLQASAQHEMAEWMQVIQNGTAACLGSLGVRASAREEEAALPVVREVAGNGACADCGAPAPTWASINLGVTICLACAGVHRRLGTHLSKVRSLELDTRQWSATQLALMVALGNQRVNRCYYARPPPCDEAIDATSAPAAREAFLRAKYERRAFTARRGQPPPPPPHVLAAAAAADDAAAIIEAMALGAPLDSPAPGDASPAPPLPPPPPDAGAATTGDREDGAEGGSGSGADGGVEGGTAADGAAAEGAAAEGAAAAPVWSETLAREHAGRTPLHVAAAEGAMRALELMLLNTIGVDPEDGVGKTPLRVAVDRNRAEAVSALLTRGANISHADVSGMTPMGSRLGQHGHEELAQTMLEYKRVTLLAGQSACALSHPVQTAADLANRLAQDEKLLAQVIVDE
ncbi:hypothetical protein EMIHUDRAFT_631957 [Emiliania huxleyi CCMP1516]|uniref:Uncharacterized protein n=2 Tax=Emiliania huxleyi TaxID=2903 RepID=A0A0D3IGC1_EMIH1|nr:hypothetical protein EMIHUDRAFT_631957 [Emiliania huxleyi CCMP1516]EOD10306.1 hypothetical protein EMIHUDRAFT_631957 [Emiliania huxleyi CCMP1516]|eukprot:XP_005762735.1 hypothetical protein EMIHUDRAFT_631957 [Emiliania huxleyi CCMP1516]